MYRERKDERIKQNKIGEIKLRLRVLVRYLRNIQSTTFNRAHLNITKIIYWLPVEKIIRKNLKSDHKNIFNPADKGNIYKKEFWQLKKLIDWR
jgi:hypothetical protein